MPVHRAPPPGADRRGAPAFLSVTTLDRSNAAALAPGLSALVAAIRGDRPAPDFWSWCYLERPSGASALVVALRDGRVVGRIGWVGARFIVDGRQVMAALHEGLQVLPRERSWTTYRAMMERFAAVSGQSPAAFAYAFVTHAASALAEWLGGTCVGRVPLLIGLLHGRRALSGRGIPAWLSPAGRLVEPWLRLRRHPPRRLGVRIQDLGRFDTAFDGLWQSVAPAFQVAAVRDAAYLNWRYAARPGRGYTALGAWRGRVLAGFLVFRVRPERQDALILDFLTRPDLGAASAAEVAEALLQAALERMRHLDVGLVAASFPRGSPEEAALRACGFLPHAERLLRIDLLVWPGTAGLPRPVRCLRRWFFTLGDSLTY